MTTRRELLRFASLATASGCTLTFPNKLFGSERGAFEEIERTHYFHAESSALRGEPGSRLMHALPTQSSLNIASAGGYISHIAPAFQLDGAASFKSAYTEVSGTGNQGHGWATISTSVIEGLNIADVVTADRVVARISTEHPAIGYVPSVSFLGTHFENLNIAGKPVKPQLNLSIMGEKPAGGVPYLSHPEFLSRVIDQSNSLSAHPEISSTTLARYGGRPLDVGGGEEIEFSLVHQTSAALSGKTFTHVIQVPGFGTIHLATVKVSQSDYEGAAARATTVQLTMIEMQTNDGTTGAGNLVTNGGTRP